MRLPPQSVDDGVHGAALNVPLTVGTSVENGKRTREKLRGDPEERGEPHPEDRAGSAHVDGDGDAPDVAETDGAGQGTGECSEVRDVALIRWVVVLAAQDVECVEEVAERQEAGV